MNNLEAKITRLHSVASGLWLLLALFAVDVSAETTDAESPVYAYDYKDQQTVEQSSVDVHSRFLFLTLLEKETMLN